MQMALTFAPGLQWRRWQGSSSDIPWFDVHQSQWCDRVHYMDSKSKGGRGVGAVGGGRSCLRSKVSNRSFRSPRDETTLDTPAQAPRGSLFTATLPQKKNRKIVQTIWCTIRKRKLDLKAPIHHVSGWQSVHYADTDRWGITILMSQFCLHILYLLCPFHFLCMSRNENHIFGSVTLDMTMVSAIRVHAEWEQNNIK